MLKEQQNNSNSTGNRPPPDRVPEQLTQQEAIVDSQQNLRTAQHLVFVVAELAHRVLGVLGQQAHGLLAHLDVLRWDQVEARPLQDPGQHRRVHQQRQQHEDHREEHHFRLHTLRRTMPVREAEIAPFVVMKGVTQASQLKYGI